MDNEKGLLTPDTGHEEPVNAVIQPRSVSLRTRRLGARAQVTVFLTSLIGLWLWFYSHWSNENFALSTDAELQHDFEHWPLFIDDHSDSDECSSKKGHHWNPHRRPRFLNGKPAEKIFLQVPNNESAIATSHQFAGKPHMAGTDGDYDTAIDFLKLVQKEFGIPSHGSLKDLVFDAGSDKSRKATLDIQKLKTPTAWVDTYYPVLNSPLDRSLEILDDDGQVVWKADIEEVTETELDPDAGKYSDAVPTFHGLSRGGEATGKLIYVNYGRKEDYDELDAKGVNFTNAIVIARYGGIFRGLKVKGAQDRGAVGALIYSDLRDDGSVTSENGYAAYPYGPARNPTSVQRGSVQFLSIYPGDPTTPGYPSYENSTRTDGENIPKIPSLPISWNTASRLLEEIKEGGKNRTVKLVNHVDDKVTPIWNTMAVIPGLISDEVVLVGNHRDAWVLGATDPTSGTVSTYELVRGLGVLLKEGWRPIRTIVIASWDAEEYGLVGSTEWGEDFSEWIENHVVAYLNLDSSVSGSRFSIQASPSLAHLARKAAEDLSHPTIANRTLWQARLDTGVLFGAVDEEALNVWEQEHGIPLLEEGDLPPADTLAAAIKGGNPINANGVSVRSASTGIRPLGSGSDYTVFLQRIGIASTNGGFGSTLHDPVYHYHSVFDSNPWQERYGDPGFLRHVAVSKHLGLQLLRLADATILPLNTTQYASELDEYLDVVETISKKGNFKTNFSDLRSSIKKLQKASNSLDKEKVHAEKELKKVIRKIRKSHKKHGHGKLFCKLPKAVRKFLTHIGVGKGKECDSSKRENDDAQEHHMRLKPRIGRYPAWRKEQFEKAGKDDMVSHPPLPTLPVPTKLPDHPKIPHPPLPTKFPSPPEPPKHPAPPSPPDKHPHPPIHIKPKLIKKLIKAAKRVRAVNQKLVTFERGFISEDGIKDREWYKHLAVAPGKWLGYGATTFPALTESLTYDKNATLAKAEAKRLQKLIDDLAKEIKV